jgi:hypothetical protein
MIVVIIARIVVIIAKKIGSISNRETIKDNHALNHHKKTTFYFLFMSFYPGWRVAREHPDFRTICRFRSTHLDSIKDVFSQVVTICK